MIRPAFTAGIALVLLSLPVTAQVRRVVILKLDGVPADILERELQRIDPQTRRSTLPWIDRVFNQGGARVPNFYVRAISLSAPSWSLLDTGQHLQIRGNAEFDRYTDHVYDYLNFFPFYLGYALSHKVDMPGVEVLDSLRVPLLIDRFSYQSTYQSFQLYQRGVRWKTLQQGLENRFARSLRELLDEWTIGFEVASSIEDQTERELIQKLADPNLRYLDYFTGDFDHVAHLTSDSAAQRQALQRIDGLVGRIWTAIESSPLAAQTLLVVVSDHGINTQPGVVSQGYDLVKFFNSHAGGGHHVVTDRHPLAEYKLKGLDPFVSEVVTPSEESPYPKAAPSQFPTALLDLDGNERASVYLRHSDWNALQVLLDAMNLAGTQPDVRRASVAAFFQTVDRHRAEWTSTVQQLREELAAVRSAIDQRKLEVKPAKWSAADRAAGLDKAARRLSVQLEAWRDQVRGYAEYAEALSRLLALAPADFDKHRFTAEDLIPKRAMGDANSLHDLENYIAGPGLHGLVLAPGGSLDFERSFEHIDYFPLLAALSVRNNVQPAVSSHPVDFCALRIPGSALPLPLADSTPEDAVWLYSDGNRQALILSRHDSGGNLQVRYLPERDLRQDADGSFHFQPADPAPGFPLLLFEDDRLAVPANERVHWLNSWHSERDWLNAVHETRYSNGILALHEQFLRTEPPAGSAGGTAELQRFSFRLRRLAEADFVIFANDHWNFNVRGFNPGGNHGSLLRMSTRSVLMMAGGSETGIPRGRLVQQPYDSLDFVPTILELMDQKQDARKLPGRLIVELLNRPDRPAVTP